MPPSTVQKSILSTSRDRKHFESSVAAILANNGTSDALLGAHPHPKRKNLDKIK